MIELQADLPIMMVSTISFKLVRTLFLPHYSIFPNTLSVQQRHLSTPVTIKTFSCINLLTIDFKIIQYEKREFPLQTRVAGKFKSLRTTTVKDSHPPKMSAIVRQVYFPRTRASGLQAKYGLSECWILVKYEDGNGSLVFSFTTLTCLKSQKLVLAITSQKQKQCSLFLS